MGYWSDKEIEMQEDWDADFVAPEPNVQYVCPCHFNNRNLSSYIRKHGHKGVCSFCDEEDIVMDFSDFMQYVGDRLTSYLGPIDNEDMFLRNSFLDKDEDDDSIPGWCVRGLYIAPSDVEYYEEAYEMMDDFDLVTDNDDLNDEIANCFNVNQWIRKDPTSLLMKDELMFSWRNFSDIIKTRNRYTFFRSLDYYDNPTGTPGFETDIIAETSGMVRLLEEIIDAGTHLYRGRPDDDDAPFTTFKSLTAPPADHAKANRMSPYGISMFYGSFDKDTPEREIRNYLEDKVKKIYVGEFVTTKPLKVINLCNIPAPNFWMEDKDDWQRYAFLRDFHKEISKPTGSKDPELEYIPSQVFCEYLRFIQYAKDGSRYDGLIYQSALTRKSNIVLFYDNESSEEILKLEAIC